MLAKTIHKSLIKNLLIALMSIYQRSIAFSRIFEKTRAFFFTAKFYPHRNQKSQPLSRNEWFLSHARALTHASREPTAINQEANCRVMLVKCFSILGAFFFLYILLFGASVDSNMLKFGMMHYLRASSLFRKTRGLRRRKEYYIVEYLGRKCLSFEVCFWLRTHFLP